MIEGALALFSGMGWLFSKPALRSVLWRVLGLLLVLLVGVVAGVHALADWLAAMWIPEGDAWYWQALGWLAAFASWLVALLAGAMSFTALGSAAAAPWLDELAARAEAEAGMDAQVADVPWWRQVLNGLANALRPLPALLGWGLVALALFLVPVVGQLAASVVWGWAGIRFMNFGLMDAVAERRGWDYARRRQALKRRRWFWLGFGGAAMAITMVPILNLLALPAATVALARRPLPE